MGNKTREKQTPTWEPVILGWLVPGLGYYFLRDLRKAFLAFLVVMGLFILGLVYGGGILGLQKDIPITHLVPLASLGCGPVYLIALFLHPGEGGGAGPYPAGVTLIWIAGALNILFLADTYFRPRGKKFILSCVLSWCLPGAGHIARGRYMKGLIFFVMILLLFFFGMALQGKLYTLEKDKPLTILATFADLGIGPIYYFMQWLGFGQGDIECTTFELGNTFILVAGLLNMLVILDVFDLSRRRGIYAEADENREEG